MAVIETWLKQELKEPVKVQHLCGNFFSHNGNANLIGVNVFDNGEPVSLSGTVSGYVVLSDGTTVPCIGSLSGNQASVLLPAAAYVPGNICVTIMLTSGTTITTLAALTGTVVRARTDSQVDPGSVVTDWTNTINSALQTVENYTGNIIAVPYASLTYPVPLGKYCIYNDLLYRCISPIASSENWTASHWTQIKLADDVSDLKSALSFFRKNAMREKVADNLDIVIGGVNASTGANTTSTKRCRTPFIKLNPGCVYLCELANTQYRIVNVTLYQTDSATSYTRYADKEQIESILETQSNENYLRLTFAYTADDNHTMTSTDVSNISAAFSVFGYTDENLIKIGVPADAKATGDRFDSVNASIRTAESMISKDATYTLKVPYSADFNIIDNGINGGTGANLSSTKRCRTQYIGIDSDTDYLFHLNDTNYKIINAWCYYYQNSEWIAQNKLDVNGSNVVFVRASANGNLPVGFRVSFSRYDDTIDITSEDKTAIKSAVSITKLTDNTLLLSNVPADAKTTGDKLTDILNAVQNINPTELDWAEWYGKNTHPTGWMTGYYNSSTGATQNSNLYIRTLNYHRDMSNYFAMVVEPPTGYFIGVVEWDQSNVYVGRTNVYDKRIILTNGHKFAFMVGRFENQDAEDYITDEFISQIRITLLASTQTSSDKKAKTGDYEFFSVIVDRPLSFGGDEITSTQEEVECVLRLPNSYTTSGKPSQLILACHGASGYIDKSNVTWYSSDWKTFMDELLEAGYAVFDANVLPTSTGTSQMGYAVGSPLYVNVLKKAYDYIQHNYNVTERILVHGSSMGGAGATDFVNAFPSLVLAESSFAGRDLLQYVHNVKDTIDNRTGGNILEEPDEFAKSFGYNDFASLVSDKWSHIDGLSPSLAIKKYNNGIVSFPPDRNTDFSNWLSYYWELYEHGENDPIGDYTAFRSVPYKAWDSWADNEQRTKAKLILQKAYRMGGNVPFEVVVYQNIGHNSMTFGKVEGMIPALITWFKRWDHYEHANDSDDE